MRLGHKNSTELHHFTIHHVSRNSLERFVFSNCRRYSPNIIHSIVYICMMFIFLQSDFEGLFFLESLAMILCIFCFAWATSYKLNTSKLTPFAFFTSFFLISSHKVMSRTKRTKSVSVAPLRQNLGQSLVLPSPPQVLQSNECA